MLVKSEIRRINKARRNAMDKSEVAEKSAMAAKAFLESELYKKARQLMLYMPLGNETDTADIMDAAFRDGKTVVLPVTDGETGRITPCVITKDTEFKIGAFKVKEPVNVQPADMAKTDVILVPGIAYDEKGSRVGFGKGCYDMLLSVSQAVNVGYCYEFQVAGEIEAEEHDVKMDYLVTEKGLRKIK